MARPQPAYLQPIRPFIFALGDCSMLSRIHQFATFIYLNEAPFLRLSRSIILINGDRNWIIGNFDHTYFNSWSKRITIRLFFVIRTCIVICIHAMIKNNNYHLLNEITFIWQRKINTNTTFLFKMHQFQKKWK